MFIKLGKAFAAIRRDGIFVGGRRVLSYLLVFLKTIFSFQSGSVLIITAGVGDSAIYRAYNQAEELNMHGIATAVMIQDNPFLPRFADRFKVFVFHRTLYTPLVARLIKRIKEQKKEIIFDTDDLVFETKYVQRTDHYKNMSYFEKKQYEKGVGAEILTDAAVKVCTTSTQFIATKLAEYGKKVFVIPNKLSADWLKMADGLLEKNRTEKKAEDRIRVGYFSGTIGHNKDFSIISDALVKILEKYSNVEIFLAGPLKLEDKFRKYDSRIIRSPYVSREKHFKNIFNCDIILAPLEIGDEFSEGKSELKFFEAGILEVPIVAARNQTFSEAITDSENGFLAELQEEWISKLSRLIENATLRKKIGQKAREKALRDYSTQNSHSEDYYNYLKSKL